MKKVGDVARQAYYRLRKSAKERVDPTPIEVPITQPPTLKEMVRSIVRTEVSRAAYEQGFDTFEEHDDFSEEDPDPDFTSRYEVREMEEEDIQPPPKAPKAERKAPEETEEDPPKAADKDSA